MVLQSIFDVHSYHIFEIQWLEKDYKIGICCFSA